ncbi:flagellar biosynthesis regulator FlaF [Litoreibacter roseus]|uniref:Flagellar biosynthesis regulatory protein FlaF n=1 Tax=Litoreibacter roseus TaxID=2601869 RepID=A0A6N6JGA9_9RHOB|nr:flagellar biosynthesis regulator FlaF [Litoreibacter roseus]GFE64419.1 flagellar biosynthesis regulatory protein FlaF [Litoreibacter roseus]
MNMSPQTQSNFAQTGYGQNSVPLRTDRAVEYDAFVRVTRDLRSAWANKDKNFPAFVSAIHNNRKLWVLLATSVADHSNQLSAPLRAQIFYLAEFTEQKSRAILRDKETPEVLIDLNMAIMRGLSAKVSS